MKPTKHYVCKKTAYHMDGSRLFELGQAYRHRKTDGNVIYLVLNGETRAVTKEYFKEHFKMKAV